MGGVLCVEERGREGERELKHSLIYRTVCDWVWETSVAETL